MIAYLEKLKLDLRLFDTTTQTTLLSPLSSEMKTFYSDYLIDLAEPKLVYNQFGDEYDIPQGSGKIIEFRQFDTLDKATTALTEGTTPDGNSISVSVVTATIAQYGDWTRLSDILQMTAIDNNVLQCVKRHGSQAGRTLDTLTRDVLLGGSEVIYAGNWSGSTESANSARCTMDTTAVLMPDHFFQAAAVLAAQNAEPIGDSYAAIIHPYAKYDLIRQDEWIDVATYSKPENWFNGEIGKIGNVRFVETSEAKIFYGEDLTEAERTLTIKSGGVSDAVKVDVDEAITSDEATALAGRYVIINGVRLTIASATAGNAKAAYLTLTSKITANAAVKVYPGEGGAAGIAVFGTIVLAQNAFARTKISGGGLQTMVKQLGYGEDPLDQRSAVGWKATHVAKRLVEDYMIRIESTGKFSSTATAN
jgi:N4-gp56 family major capsid protein